MGRAVEPAAAGKVLVPLDERWSDAWVRHARGESVASIAQRYEVAGVTVYGWIRKVAEREAERDEDFQVEKAKLIAQYEAAITASWDAFNATPPTTKTSSEHMGNLIKALEKLGRLRGMEQAPTKPQINLIGDVGGTDGETEVTIRVGGVEMVRRRIRHDREVLNGAAIEVPSGPVAEGGGAPGGARAALLRQTAGDRESDT